jgi:hypothetical protein
MGKLIFMKALCPIWAVVLLALLITPAVANAQFTYTFASGGVSIAKDPGCRNNNEPFFEFLRIPWILWSELLLAFEVKSGTTAEFKTFRQALRRLHPGLGTYGRELNRPQSPRRDCASLASDTGVAQPQIVLFRFQDERHPVVILRHGLVWRGGEHRVFLHAGFLAPQPGNAKQLAVRLPEQHAFLENPSASSRQRFARCAS